MNSVRGELASYVASLGELGLLRLAGIMTLVIVGTAAEVVGIVLLIPLLGLVFEQLPDGQAGGLVGSGIQSALAPLPPTGQLLVLLGAFVVLITLRALLAWRRDLQLMRLSFDLVDSWRARIVRAVAGASWQRLQSLQNSRLEFAITSEVARLAVGSDRLLRGGVAVLQLGLVLVSALLLSSKLTLLALACGLIGLPLLLRLAGTAHRYGEGLSRDGSKRQHVLSEFLAGMKLAKVHDAEQRYAGTFIAITNTMRQRALAFADAQMRGQNAFQLAGGLAAAIVALVGLVFMDTTPVLLSALLVLLTRIIAPAQQLAQAAQAILTMLPAVGHLTEIEAKLGTTPAPIDSRMAGRAPVGPISVSMRSITYRPAGRDLPVLCDVNCKIGPGELAVLLGPSGSGKTTLADVLLGLIEPDRGDIEVDGSPIRGASALAGFRRRVAYVPQEPFLFDQSVRENLLWAEPDASESDLWQALQQAEATDFISKMEAGLETAVGNRGSHLSGGERQRICLARALLRRPGLLILDEATSALDRGVEERLLETLVRLRGKMTLLIIAHRLPDWLRADVTFTLEGGVLQAQPGPAKAAASGRR